LNQNVPSFFDSRLRIATEIQDCPKSEVSDQHSTRNSQDGELSLNFSSISISPFLFIFSSIPSSKMRFINLLSLTLLSATPLLSSVSAQADGAPVDPNATCDQATLDSITTCLGQVYTDESARDGGPCTSSDSAENWACICNVQVSKMGAPPSQGQSHSTADRLFFGVFGFFFDSLD